MEHHPGRDQDHGPGERKGTGNDIHLPRKLGHRHPRGLLLGLGEFVHEVHFARGTSITISTSLRCLLPPRPRNDEAQRRGHLGYSAGLSIEEALRNPAPGVSIRLSSPAQVNARHLSIKVRVAIPERHSDVGYSITGNSFIPGDYRIAAPPVQRKAPGTPGP